MLTYMPLDVFQMRRENRLTPEVLKHFDVGEGAWVHRHPGEHIYGDTCWCCPMWVTPEFQRSHSQKDLVQVLASFYAVQ